MLTLAWQAAPWRAALAAALATGAGAIAERSGWFLACEADGVEGVGEAVPWPTWGTETPDDVAATLAGWPATSPAPDGLDDVPTCLAALGLDAARTPALWAGAELALLDWLARRAGVPLAALLAPEGAPIDRTIPVAALIGADAPAAAARAATAAVAAGHRVVKLKVGGTDDPARVAAVRAVVGPDVALRLDANGAWPNAAAAAVRLAELMPFAPAFVEQPVPAADVAGLVKLAAQGLPVAADEVLGVPGAAEALLAGGVKVLVVKPLVHGGLLAARRLIERARAAGAEVVLSSALDRGVGTAGVAHLAAAVGGPPAGLGTANWWADGGMVPYVRAVGGAIHLPTTPGLSITPLWGGDRHEMPGAGDLLATRSGSPAPAASRLSPPQGGGTSAGIGLVADGETWTHAHLDAIAHDLATRLPTGPIALWGPNAAEWVHVARAAWRRGATLLPLPPRWTDAEAADVLARVRPALVVGPPAFAARAAALGHPALDYAALAAAPAAQPGAPSSIAALVPTSGTTGAPKLAMLPAAGLAATADATAAALGLGPGDAYWLPLPLHHVGGLGALWRAWRAGAALVLGTEGAGATHASLVPTQLLDLAGAPWPDGLRAVMVGGAAPPPDLAARCPAAWSTYGLTEGGGTVTLAPAGEAAGTAGPPLPGWEVRILDEDGSPLPAGREGAIAVRGPGTMAGYLDDPAATARALQDGWLRTGDLGTLDDRGYVAVLGRRDDLIVSGGENVYPAEVEAALRAHPAIADVAVVAAPDPRWGHVPHAWLVAAGEGRPDLPELRAFLADRLAAFKHPRAIAWMDALPRLASGKIDRRLLRDRAAEVRV